MDNTEKNPIYTGEYFQILELIKGERGWFVRAKLHSVEKTLEVEGSQEDVLQIVDTLSRHSELVENLKDKEVFQIENGYVKAPGIELLAEKINPFSKRIFTHFIKNQ